MADITPEMRQEWAKRAREARAAKMAERKANAAGKEEVGEDRKPERLLKRARVPLTSRNKLTAPEDADANGKYVLRVVNDDPQHQGRVEEFKGAGWEVVTGDGLLGDPTVEYRGGMGSAITRPVGNGVTGVLMRKLKEEFEEDMKPVHDHNDNIEQAIFGSLDEADRYGRVSAFGRTVERK